MEHIIYILFAAVAVAVGVKAIGGATGAMRDCPHCRKTISGRASVCPNCGRDVAERNR